MFLRNFRYKLHGTSASVHYSRVSPALARGFILGTGSGSIHLTDTLDPQAGCVLDFSAKLFQLFILLSEMMVTYEHLKRGKNM